ncbi:MAG: DUF1080 domain-containing protein [Ignavibacteriae bacterium]|nr:DUF1080 domain-containing protein [Ignavibacteriota bacterium]
MLNNMSFLLLYSTLLISCFNIPKTEKSTADERNFIPPKEKITLWNGNDFSNWTIFIPDKNLDVKTVWNVKDNLLNCSGIPISYIRTNVNYSNYKLTVVWRWPSEPGNSGVLIHAQLPDEVWPKCIEAQLMHENAGDFYVINGTDFTELTDKNSRRLQKKNNNSENKPGDWNKYEILCKGNSIELFVNGVFQNKATNCTVSNGTIGLQSEGKPIQFKEIFIEPID